MLIFNKLGKEKQPMDKNLFSNKQHSGLKPNLLVTTNENPYINPLSIADKYSEKGELNTQNLTASINESFEWQPTFNDIANILNKANDEEREISGFMNDPTNKDWFKQKSLEQQSYDYFKSINEQAEKDKRTRYEFFGLGAEEIAKANAQERDNLVKKASSGLMSEAEKIAMSRWITTLPFDTTGMTYNQVVAKDRAMTAGIPTVGMGMGAGLGSGGGVAPAPAPADEPIYPEVLEEEEEETGGAGAGAGAGAVAGDGDLDSLPDNYRNIVQTYFKPWSRVDNKRLSQEAFNSINQFKDSFYTLESIETFGRNNKRFVFSDEITETIFEISPDGEVATENESDWALFSDLVTSIGNAFKPSKRSITSFTDVIRIAYR